MIKSAIVLSKVSMTKSYDPLILAETLRYLLTVNRCIVLNTPIVLTLLIRKLKRFLTNQIKLMTTTIRRQLVNQKMNNLRI